MVGVRGAGGRRGAVGRPPSAGHAVDDAGGLRLRARDGDPRGRRRDLPARLPADAADRAAAPGRAGAPVTAGLTGMLLGLVAAIGLVPAIRYAPPFRSVRLVDRLAPYVHDTPPPSRLLGTATEPGLLTAVRRVFGPAVG